jgi:NAD(P)-dependent dehydrogenase (short-subunit alcohol dehydrogenase family)
MKEITITGSEGLIGSTLCKYFEKQKRSVNKLDLKLGHDLTDESFVKKWFKNNPTKYLVNCFALNDHIDKKKRKSNLYNFSLDQFSKYLETNVTALFSVCKEFSKNNKTGSIVNFSSTYGLVSPNPKLYEKSQKNIAYCVSKGAVINLTKYLAAHLAPSIRVNCVVPGGVLFKQSKKFRDSYSKLTPMKRMMHKNELNEIIEFLCSDNSSYTTGSVLVIDGGYTIW